MIKGATLSYAGLVTVAVLRARPRIHDADPLVLVAAFPVMHVAWGAGFLSSVVEMVLDR